MMPRAYNKPIPACKVEGCGAPMKARGMCDMHYKRWHRATLVKPSPPDTRQLVIDSLPGTFHEVAAAAGICYDTALIFVNALHDATPKQAFIDDWIQPGTRAGSAKFVAVWALGDKEDAKPPSRLQKKKARLASQRYNHHRRKAERSGDPLVNALFGKSKPKETSNASS